MQEKYMLMAIEEAKKAIMMNEVPVGAVLVKDNKVLAKAYNQKEKCKCVTKHAEILVVEKVSSIINNWRLEGCDIYITLEPCPMCASAIKQARISNVYYGVSNRDTNNGNIIRSIFEKDKINPAVKYSCGYFEKEIIKLMNDFFTRQRDREK